MTVNDAIVKMIDECNGNQYDIGHFLKVWAYSKLIGEQEGLDERLQQTLEFAAIVHDISCPGLRAEHGSAPGNLQEQAGPPLARVFFEGSGLDQDMIERICDLVGHHHTYQNVEGMDWQILLEADFLVNAGEQEKYRKQVDSFRKKVFRTETGIRLLDGMYGGVR